MTNFQTISGQLDNTDDGVARAGRNGGLSFSDSYTLSLSPDSVGQTITLTFSKLLSGDTKFNPEVYLYSDAGSLGLFRQGFPATQTDASGDLIISHRVQPGEAKLVTTLTTQGAFQGDPPATYTIQASLSAGDFTLTPGTDKNFPTVESNGQVSVDMPTDTISTTTATSGNDSIVGGEANDTLFGGLGRDVLTGGSGDDVLVGGGEQDFLIGGEGADVFVLDEPSYNPFTTDIITDFNPDEGDRIATNFSSGLDLTFTPINLSINGEEPVVSTLISYNLGSADPRTFYLGIVQGTPPEELDPSSFVSTQSLGIPGVGPAFF